MDPSTSIRFRQNSHKSSFEGQGPHYLFRSKTSRSFYYSSVALVYLAIYVFALFPLVSSEDFSRINIIRSMSISTDVVAGICLLTAPFILFYLSWRNFHFFANARSEMMVIAITLLTFALSHFSSLVELYLPFSTFTVTFKFVSVGAVVYSAAMVIDCLPMIISLPSIKEFQKELENRKMAEYQLQRQFQKIVTIREVSQEIRKFYKAKDIFKTVVEQLGLTIDLSQCLIIFNFEDSSHAEYEFRRDPHTTPSVNECPTITLKKSVFMAQALLRETVTIMTDDDIANDAALSELVKAWNIRQLMCIPTSAMSAYNGLIVMIRRNDDELCNSPWSQEDEEIVEGIVAQSVHQGLSQAVRLAAENAREVAEEANKTKSEFLAMISHELRTPLNGVLGMVNILQNSPSLAKTEKKCLKTIESCSNALLSLVNSLLDFSNIEASKLEVEKGNFDLHKSLTSVVAMASNATEGRSIEIKLEAFPPDLPRHILGDKYRLQQILVNLISNGIKFTEKGHVVIRASVMNSPPKAEVVEGSEPAKKEQPPLLNSSSENDSPPSGPGTSPSVYAQVPSMSTFSTFTSLIRTRSKEVGASIESTIASATAGLYSADASPINSPPPTLRVTPKSPRESVDYEVVQYTPKKSTITLRFDVEDTGIGIPSSSIANLFKPFSQIDHSMTRKYGGTGLGLAIARKLCSSMGGQMNVTSQIGVGSIFSFTIEAEKSSESEIKNKSTKEIQVVSEEMMKKRKKAKILVAEDNKVNQMVVIRILKLNGFENICITMNGEETTQAVRKAQLENNPYDVILMDLHMPILSGTEATILIRKEIPSRTRPYIIALTADIQPPIKKYCKDIGMNDFIGKPFETTVLCKAIQKGLEIEEIVNHGKAEDLSRSEGHSDLIETPKPAEGTGFVE